MRHPLPIEIMAPVGSYESLMAAVQGGAGSVYFGVGQLNMRSRSASNFAIEDLPEISRICRKHGLRSYLTLNTVVFDHEHAEARSIIDAVKENEISAIIATDPSVIQYARSQDVEVHMSTQANITNIEAVRFWSHFADVMVTARELSLDQVAGITRQIREQHITGPSGKLVQIEIFVHGALCMAVSGKCYLSLDLFNFSGNRGACLQPCRRPYIVTDRDKEVELAVEHEYIMSPKDLCTIGILDKILEAGVTVLKIEGRGRPADYVKLVTGVYREAVEAILAGTYTPEQVIEWENRLKTVYNRGFWEGYYLGRKMGEWAGQYGSVATTRKVYAGKVTNFYKKNSVAEITLESTGLDTGDVIAVIGPSTGVHEQEVQEIRVDEVQVLKAEKGDVCSIPVTTVVRRSDKVYKVVDASQIKESYYPKEETTKLGLSNYHTHTLFCDGKGSVDDHVNHVITLGFSAIGFSSHGPLPFPNEFALQDEDVETYIREVRKAAKKYSEKIDVYLGMELDYIPGVTKDFTSSNEEYGLDYIIGGVHLVRIPDTGELWFIDGPHRASYDDGLQKYFGGNIRRAVTAYYEQVYEMLDCQKMDIIAHADKIKMHNANRFFRQDEPWYRDLALAMLDRIKKAGVIMEINTRGLYKQRSDELFPAPWLIREAAKKEIPVLLSADAHSPGEHNLFFREALAAISEAGYKAVMRREDQIWKPTPVSGIHWPQ